MTSTEVPGGGSVRRPIPTSVGSAMPFDEHDTLYSSVDSTSDDEDASGTSLKYGSVEPSVLLDEFPAPLVESLRFLVGRFQLGDGPQFGSRLGVVSALHGEGATTISRALAAVIANDLDVRVCWVDLSWPSHDAATRKEPLESGIYEVLTGQMELSEVLQKTEDHRLMILRPGQMPDAQRQLIARSSALATLLDDLDNDFQCVLFDMPPILAGSAGLGLIRHAKSYLLVVRHGVTTTHQVRSAVEELRSIPSVGVVLNRFKSRIPKWLAHVLAS